MRELGPRQLQIYLKEAERPPLLLDVREPWEYQRARIAESTLIPMREIPAALARLDPNQELVVICHHGIRSRQVARFLESRGFGQVINLSGGIDAWAREVDPSIPFY